MEKRLFLAILLSAAILCVYNIVLHKIYIKEGKEGREEVPVPIQKKILKASGSILTPLLKCSFNEEGDILSLALRKYKEAGSTLELKAEGRPLFCLRKRGAKKKVSSTLSDERAEFTILFEDGLCTKKIYEFHKDKYFFDLTLKAENRGSRMVEVEDFGVFFCQDTLKVKERAYFYKGEKRKVKGRKFMTEGVEWIGEASRHFAFLILSKEKEASFFGEEGMGYTLGTQRLHAGGSMKRSFRIYIGPKDYKRLHHFHEGAQELVGLNALALFVLYLLNFFYRITHNYGVAIILLTVLVKAALFPLSQKGLKAMRSMQALAPKIERLKQLYGENKQRLQQEIVQLYKKEGVNPLSGCLPLILQIPIFYALFTALTRAVELRGKGFVWWLKDLSAKDPYYILPLLMGATMFLQQRLGPQDPRQKHLNILLPFIFTLMFCTFPSGIVLYWLVQNLLTIIHQALIVKGGR